MRFIGPDAGRVVLFYSPEEVRPEAPIFGPSFINYVQGRYRFVSAPDLAELKGDVSTLTFRSGRLGDLKSGTNIDEFTMIPGAVAVDAFSTDDCEKFLEDFISWGMEFFGWNRPKTIRQRVFSSIVVEFDAPALKMLDGFEAVCALFSDALRERYEIGEPYDLTRLVLSADPMALPTSAVQTDVTIQRRAEIPYTANRFHCTGPFRTAELVTLMERAEAALLGKRKRK